MEVLDQWIKKRPHFEEGIVTFLTFLDVLVVVIQVQELEQKREAVTLDDLSINKNMYFIINIKLFCFSIIIIHT